MAERKRKQASLESSDPTEPADKSLSQEAAAQNTAGTQGALGDTGQDTATSNAAEIEVTNTTADTQNVIAESADHLVLERDSEDADKQVSNAGITENNKNAAKIAQTPPPIFCAPAPIKPT